MEKKIVLSTSCAGTIRHPHAIITTTTTVIIMIKNCLDLSVFLYKKQLKMDYSLKWKV